MLTIKEKKKLSSIWIIETLKKKCFYTLRLVLTSNGEKYVLLYS